MPCSQPGPAVTVAVPPYQPPGPRPELAGSIIYRTWLINLLVATKGTGPLPVRIGEVVEAAVPVRNVGPTSATFRTKGYIYTADWRYVDHFYKAMYSSWRHDPPAEAKWLYQTLNPNEVKTFTMWSRPWAENKYGTFREGQLFLCRWFIEYVDTDIRIIQEDLNVLVHVEYMPYTGGEA